MHTEQIHTSLETLRADPELMPWPQREDLPRTLVDVLRGPGDAATREAAIEACRLLADDLKWEVRKAVAGVLEYLPEELFVSLASEMTQDSNDMVRFAAQRSFDRRRKVQWTKESKHRGGDDLADEYERLRREQPLAADAAWEWSQRRTAYLMGVLVHDLKSLLTPHKASVLKRLTERSGGAESDQRIRDSLSMIETYLRDMELFSQTLPPDRRYERAADVITDGVATAFQAAKSVEIDVDSVRFVLERPPEATVCVSPMHIRCAIGHIVKNALEACAGRKKAEVRLAATVVSGELQIEVRDNGVGLSADELAEIEQFVPGRRNKRKKQSTGFGLPSARKYVEAHGGRLSITGVEDQGATVRLSLPIAEEDVE